MPFECGSWGWGFLAHSSALHGILPQCSVDSASQPPGTFLYPQGWYPLGDLFDDSYTRGVPEVFDCQLSEGLQDQLCQASRPDLATTCRSQFVKSISTCSRRAAQKAIRCGPDDQQDLVVSAAGVQRLAASNILAKGLAVSQAGDLFIAGRVLAAGGRSAIYKQEAAAFESGDSLSPKRLWTAGDGSWLPTMLETGLPSMSEPMSPSTPELFQPGAVAVDMFTVYWGNLIKSNVSAALASAPATVPMPRPGGAIPKVKAGAHALANSFESVTGLAMTSAGMFFAGRPKEGLPGVFALPNRDVTAGCSEDDHCVRRVAQVGNALSLCWDGDSTLFIADGGRGAVVALPSATASQHDVEKVADARGVRGLAMLSVPYSGTQAVALSMVVTLMVCIANLL